MEMDSEVLIKNCTSCGDDFRTENNQRVLCLGCADRYFWGSDNTQLQRMVSNILDNIIKKR